MSGARIGNRLAPPRFVAFLLILPAAFVLYRYGMGGSDWKDASAMAFDMAAAVFLMSMIPLLRDASAQDMRRHARDNDANRVLVLVITSLLTIVAMTAISGELKGTGNGDPVAAAKLAITLLLIWLFANTVYTLHYAHAYYTEKDAQDAGGLDFPGTATPTYPDFAYFAFTLGMTFQTSDIAIRTQGLRKVALLHGFAAFIFNVGVIAFTINVLGG